MVAQDEIENVAEAEATLPHVEPPPLSLYGKLARVAGQAAEVPKDGNNTEFNYKYATLGTLQAMLKPLLASEGLLILPMFDSQEKVDTGARSGKGTPNLLTRVSMTYRIVDSATGELLELPWLGEAMDFGDKGFAKALTISMRTFLNQLFAIPSYDEDTDPDRASPQDHGQGNRGDPRDRGDRQSVQRRSPDRQPNNRRGSYVAPDRHDRHDRDGSDGSDPATDEIQGRLRVDKEGEPERKRVLRSQMREHMERQLQLPEPAQKRLAAALTEGRGTKALTAEQLVELLPKFLAIKFSSDVWPIINEFEGRKELASEGGEELFGEAGSSVPPVVPMPSTEGQKADALVLPDEPNVPVLELPREGD
ncbi:MAG: hypothetical protein QOH93_643 [Chloroflexia bacterium]|jgi:hypothetical protein|nr:hypothetical protein [Chloroflexia bacterium]